MTPTGLDALPIVLAAIGTSIDRTWPLALSVGVGMVLAWRRA